MRKVLITYVTKTGTTAQSAAAIGSLLQENGFETVVTPLEEACPMALYDSVIIGGPVNGMAWHPQASAFVAEHAAELAGKDISFFCMSYIYFTGKNFWRKAIAGVFTKPSGAVKPRMTGIFGGKVGERMPAFARLIFGIAKDAPADCTDFDAVREWAGQWMAGIREK